MSEPVDQAATNTIQVLTKLLATELNRLRLPSLFMENNLENLPCLRLRALQSAVQEYLEPAHGEKGEQKEEEEGEEEGGEEEEKRDGSEITIKQEEEEEEGCQENIRGQKRKANDLEINIGQEEENEKPDEEGKHAQDEETPALKSARLASQATVSMCVSCRDYAGQPNQADKCSQCFTRDHGCDPQFAHHPLVLKKAEEAKKSPQQACGWDIRLLDVFFERRLPNIAILTSEQATRFIRAYHDKPIVEMLACFNGKREFPAFILRAEDADRLCEATRYRDDWRLAHLIGPRVLDRWSMRKSDSTLDCYWRNLGQMTSPPKALAGLFDLWRYVGKSSNPFLEL